MINSNNVLFFSERIIPAYHKQMYNDVGDVEREGHRHLVSFIYSLALNKAYFDSKGTIRPFSTGT